MKVMKFYEGSPDRPKYASLVRQDEKGHLLLNEPTDKPYGKREARWVDPKDIRIVWIREFVD